MVGTCLELLYLLRKKTDKEYETFIEILQLKEEKNRDVIGVLTMDTSVEGKIMPVRLSTGNFRLTYIFPIFFKVLPMKELTKLILLIFYIPSWNSECF